MSNAPIWAKHPVTGRDIDVAPLLTVLDQFDAPANSPISTGACHAIKRIIRSMNLTVHDPHVQDPVKLANMYRDLHLLEDMFEATIERPLPPPDVP